MYVAATVKCYLSIENKYLRIKQKLEKMKWAVMLYSSGSVFTEIVIAKNEVEARSTAQARNPFARFISLTRVFN